MLLIDPTKIVQQQVPLAYLAAHLHLRQIARAKCRDLLVKVMVINASTNYFQAYSGVTLPSIKGILEARIRPA